MSKATKNMKTGQTKVKQAAPYVKAEAIAFDELISALPDGAATHAGATSMKRTVERGA